MAALYIVVLNAVTNVHVSRVAVGIPARMPAGIWIALYALIMLSMQPLEDVRTAIDKSIASQGLAR